MNSGILIGIPFSSGDRKGGSIRGQAPVVDLGQIIFDLENLVAVSFEGVEGKERELPLGDRAVKTKGGWSPCALRVGDRTGLQNLLRGATSEAERAPDGAEEWTSSDFGYPTYSS